MFLCAFFLLLVGVFFFFVLTFPSILPFKCAELQERRTWANIEFVGTIKQFILLPQFSSLHCTALKAGKHQHDWAVASIIFSLPISPQSLFFLSQRDFCLYLRYPDKMQPRNYIPHTVIKSSFFFYVMYCFMFLVLTSRHYTQALLLRVKLKFWCLTQVFKKYWLTSKRNVLGFSISGSRWHILSLWQEGSITLWILFIKTPMFPFCEVWFHSIIGFIWL